MNWHWLIAGAVLLILVTAQPAFALKDSASVRNWTSALATIHRAVSDVWISNGWGSPTYTEIYAARQGKHGTDEAMDVGIKERIPDRDWRRAAREIALALPPEFDVVLERDVSPDRVTNTSHIHVEYDPDAWKKINRQYAGYSETKIDSRRERFSI